MSAGALSREPLVGFFGKLPSSGDFVHARLPSSVIEALDEYIRQRLSSAVRVLGSAFEAAWYAAPAWRFSCRHGLLCKLHAVSGIWTPSTDRVGRCYPLVVAILHKPGTRILRGLHHLETISREVVTRAVEPNILLHRLASCEVKTSPAPSVSWTNLWWRHGGSLDGDVRVENALDHDDKFCKLLSL